MRAAPTQTAASLLHNTATLCPQVEDGNTVASFVKWGGKARKTNKVPWLGSPRSPGCMCVRARQRPRVDMRRVVRV